MSPSPRYVLIMTASRVHSVSYFILISLPILLIPERHVVILEHLEGRQLCYATQFGFVNKAKNQPNLPISKKQLYLPLCFHLSKILGKLVRSRSVNSISRVCVVARQAN